MWDQLFFSHSVFLSYLCVPIAEPAHSLPESLRNLSKTFYLRQDFYLASTLMKMAPSKHPFSANQSHNKRERVAV